jgi:hypothetical protein
MRVGLRHGDMEGRSRINEEGYVKAWRHGR